MRRDGGERVAATGGLEQQERQAHEAGIDFRTIRECNLGRLRVCALHEPNGGVERQQRCDVGLRAAQVRLQTHADVRVIGAHAPVDVERRIDERALLHVDPDHVAERFRTLDDGAQVYFACILRDVESELRELDRDLRVDLHCRDAAERVDVVSGDVACSIQVSTFSPRRV